MPLIADLTTAPDARMVSQSTCGAWLTPADREERVTDVRAGLATEWLPRTRLSAECLVVHGTFEIRRTLAAAGD